jgi:hypothetical protein
MAGKANLGRRIAAHRKRRLKRLKPRSEFGVLPSGDFRIGPPGAEKMSTVLEEFVSPFLADAEDIEDIRELYKIGVAAWNMALLPTRRQDEVLEALVGEVHPETVTDHHELQILLGRMIRRKQAYFASNRRMIVGLQIYQTGKHYQLNVMSTLGEPANR